MMKILEMFLLGPTLYLFDEGEIAPHPPLSPFSYANELHNLHPPYPSCTLPSRPLTSGDTVSVSIKKIWEMFFLIGTKLYPLEEGGISPTHPLFPFSYPTPSCPLLAIRFLCPPPPLHSGDTISIRTILYPLLIRGWGRYCPHPNCPLPALLMNEIISTHPAPLPQASPSPFASPWWISWRCSHQDHTLSSWSTGSHSIWALGYLVKEWQKIASFKYFIYGQNTI